MHERKARKGPQLTQRSEEPSVLAAGVSVLQSLLDGLLGVLALRDLLEGVLGDNTLEALELESVASGHQVVVVDDLDEGLDAAALLNLLLSHAAGDLQGVALDTGNESVGEGVRLGTSVVGLDDDDLNVREKVPIVSNSVRLFERDVGNQCPPRSPGLLIALSDILIFLFLCPGQSVKHVCSRRFLFHNGEDLVHSTSFPPLFPSS